MITNKFGLVLVISLLLSISSWANNVKIVGDIKVVPSEITNNIAPFKFTIEWENSWRDEFNYDAVYVFLKYKLDGADDAWHHLYLCDEITLTGTAGDKYSHSAVNSTGTSNKNEGLMLWRESAGFGKASVELSVKWDIKKGARQLEYSNFNDGKVFMSAMSVEMVYVPQGAYRLGDGRLGKNFRQKFLTIPADKDVVSDEYRILTKENKINPANPPQYAANKINDNDRTKPTNAWLGDGSGDQIWTIDFGIKNGKAVTGKATKRIQYIAIEGLPNHVPAEWTLSGSNEEGSTNPRELLAMGGDTSWVTTAPNVYPTNKAIRINKNVGEYRFYTVKITSLGGASGPAIKNISMCEEDLSTSKEASITSANSVIITGAGSKMTNQCGYGIDYFYTDESDTWGGTLPVVYPTGYNAFFAMKYEISQEQYVAFLNKLSLSQQATRTIGEKLVPLREGQYVFGDNLAAPTARNGIIVASRSGLTEPLVFANNLNKNDGEYAQDGDGQTLACNFLTPADMLAYGDWTGLRPLSEMEYEKMSRRPFPATPVKGEYAWNNAIATQPTGLTSGHEGKKSETVQNGNANFGNISAIGGPVRCGAFAKGASSQEASGASFWGIMDLSGNLSEIYYNANTAGRLFSGIPRGSHGNGTLEQKTGNTDVGVGVWPANEDAFALRGGSYKSAPIELETSSRAYNKGNYALGNINIRKAEASFRLGCSMPAVTVNTTMTMQNGLQTTAAANVADTICSGEDYLIKGDIPADIKGAYTISWFFSGDKGVNWKAIEGENGKDLRLTNLRNIHVGNDIFKEYRYMRHIYSSDADAKSKQAIIRVINHEISLTPDTVGVSIITATKVIVFKSNLPTTVTWQFRDKVAKDFLKTVTPGKHYTHTPDYADFFYAGAQITGTQPLVIHSVFYDKYCAAHDTVWIKIEPIPNLATDPAKVICGQAFEDSDGNRYNTVKIGTQCWMVENMRKEVSGSRCYGEDENNCRVYGRLYNWTQATSVASNVGDPGTEMRGICPTGWVIPTNNDWILVNSTAGGKGEAIKSPAGEWPPAGLDGSQMNTLGFSALPGGGKFYNYVGGPWETSVKGLYSRNDFDDAGSRAWWWTSTSNPNDITYAPEYYAWHNNYNFTKYIPYYVRLDASGALQFNTQITAGSVGFNRNTLIDNSIFTTKVVNTLSNGSYQFLAGNNENSTARTRMRTEFYMSVRCRRFTPISPGE